MRLQRKPRAGQLAHRLQCAGAGWRKAKLHRMEWKERSEMTASFAAVRQYKEMEGKATIDG